MPTLIVGITAGQETQHAHDERGHGTVHSGDSKSFRPLGDENLRPALSDGALADGHQFRRAGFFRQS
jgi:hypothetical protein